MSESYFQMKDLSVGYHGNVLIHDICTEIKKGEILTLIGPNGSGKSTILKSITKQLTLIGGKVTIGEKNLKDLSYKELATKMAVVLTQRAKPELMTCYEVVAAGRYPYTGRLGILTREDEKKTQEALEIVHATEYAEKSFEAISDGQRQRILLARAICQEPEVLIFIFICVKQRTCKLLCRKIFCHKFISGINCIIKSAFQASACLRIFQNLVK